MALLAPPAGLWMLWRRRPGFATHLVAVTAMGVLIWVGAGLVASRARTGAAPGTSESAIATPSPTPAAVVLPSAPAPGSPSIPTPVATPVPSVTTIVSLTSPVRRGSGATLLAQAAPGGQCSITITYSFGRSTAIGLEPRATSAEGTVEWDWTVGTQVPLGSWPVRVDCGASGIADTTLQVQ